MNQKRISIVTSSSEDFGMGHLQRMMNLAWFLSQNNYLQIIDTNPHTRIPPAFRRFMATSIDSHCQLIIRDMRDSSIEDIHKLQKISPVLVLDDQGPGKSVAEFSISLLPHHDVPLDTEFILNHFIFGYNFTETLRDYLSVSIEKDIDVSIYLGHTPDSKIIKQIVSLMNHNMVIAILQGGKNYIIKRGVARENDNAPWATFLLRSKILITYFGISLFEGALAGCRLITVNPTDYHSRLAEFSKLLLNLVNCGTFNSMNTENTADIISEILESCEVHSVYSHNLHQKILSNLQNITSYIGSITQKAL